MTVLKNYLGSSYDKTAQEAGFANASAARAAGYTFEDVQEQKPIAPAEETKSPITTSEPITSDLGNIDDDIAKLGLEMPTNTGSEELAKQQADLLEKQYQTKVSAVERQTAARRAEQEQANRAIMGESRAALAELGILSSEPGRVSATSAQQYLDDVKIENQKEMDRIMAEQQLLLRAASDSRDAGQFAIAQQQYDEAKTLSKERNALRLQAAQEARAIRQAEREGRAEEVELMIKKAQEERAKANFSSDRAKDALSILEKSGFKDFANYLPSEITKIELSIGLPEGTLQNYAQEATMAKAISGYESTIQTNPNTGEVMAVYYRMNPETKEIEYQQKSLGFIGDRFKGESSNDQKIINDFTSDVSDAILKIDKGDYSEEAIIKSLRANYGQYFSDDEIRAALGLEIKDEPLIKVID